LRPEVLAPAGDLESLRAAVRAGADAVYFGVQGFNARARAKNFTLEELPALMGELHAWGVKGFVTLNTLVFDDELAELERTVRALASAGVDAVIVQDLGVVSLVRAIAPTLAIHASTQMTCTDAGSVRAAASRGASRVVLARELSLEDIVAIKREVDVELEVFVHGALCVSYSGQCLTSEAIGGRSANRGACAQACRLPYDLVVDGVVKDLGDKAHLLSPEDLEAAALVPRLAEAGVSCLKIEGRLKGPAYVAAATRLYRAAVDAADRSEIERRRADALITYSRGSGPGFLAGVDHQRLVEAETCDHRGVLVGRVRAVERDGRKAWIVVDSAGIEGVEPFARGQGIFVQGAKAGRGELGGRVWDVIERREGAGLWLGPDVEVPSFIVGRRVFKNDDPVLEKRVLTENDRMPFREPIDVVARGVLGGPLLLEATSARGLRAQAQTDAVLEPARTRALDEAMVREQLSRLGDTAYSLASLTLSVPEHVTLPISSLNRARRALCDALSTSSTPTHGLTDASAAALLKARAPTKAPPPPGLFVLCRSMAQAQAAHQAGADGIWLDFLALTGLRKAFDDLKALGAPFVGAAPPRIQKPGEEKIARFLDTLPLDGVLVRSLAHLDDEPTAGRLRVGDFSLNAASSLTAREIVKQLDAFVPSFDLNARQLERLLNTEVGSFAELVVHHPMPLFHMEHCVIAATLSNGADYRTCGRPCESHVVSLRDRVGVDLPVEADVGCRNTVFHARAQSAASSVRMAQDAGVRRFRIELVREGAQDVARLVRLYRGLLNGDVTPKALFTELRAEDGYGVVQGSLRVLRSDEAAA
jgi:U32 family peptidase